MQEIPHWPSQISLGLARIADESQQASEINGDRVPATSLMRDNAPKGTPVGLVSIHRGSKWMMILETKKNSTWLIIPGIAGLSLELRLYQERRIVLLVCGHCKNTTQIQEASIHLKSSIIQTFLKSIRTFHNWQTVPLTQHPNAACLGDNSASKPGVGGPTHADVGPRGRSQAA